MKKYFLGAFLFFFVLVASAQQDPQFSQYMFNELYSNPGMLVVIMLYVLLL